MKFKVRVHSNSFKEEIRKTGEDSYEVWLKEKAEDNKANISLVKMLKRFFKSDISIKSGFSSKNKIIEVK